MLEKYTQNYLNSQKSIKKWKIPYVNIMSKQEYNLLIDDKVLNINIKKYTDIIKRLK